MTSEARAECRKAFEKWALGRRLYIRIDTNGHYASHVTQRAWLGWQSAWQAAGQRWRPIETAPKDGTPIVTSRIVRYLPYKPDGARQMRKPGRWQEFNGYGWNNCDDPAEWMPMEQPHDL